VKLKFTRRFEKAFKRLPKGVRDQTYEKLHMLLENPTHRSLRVKRIKGTERIWEMSVTMNYRVTFEIDEDTIVLRTVGTHDVLRQP
jgi:mRNA interferase RelE/StbE